MELSVSIARNIVNEVNKVIPQWINLFDSRGVVIASTDPDRVGGFHGGAMRVIKSGLPEVIVHYDGEFDGAKRGVNYPIMLQDKIIGVLGITGRYEEIATNALIIKRMTELLLENQYTLEQRHLGENVRNRYIEQWLTGDVKGITAEFVERGSLMDIDITLPRRFLDCTVYLPDNDQSLDSMRRIEGAEEAITNCIARTDRSNLYFKDGSSLVCAVTLYDDEALKKLAARLMETVEQKFSAKLAIGVDSPAESYIYARNAVARARRANKVCMRTHKWSIRFYGDLNMEVFADEVSESMKIEFVRRIYKNYSDAEIVEAVMLLDNYFDFDGSITKTADKLFLHKNTVQYKLKRIHERTGYDPRSIRHSSLFYIANYFFRDLSERFVFAKS